MDKIKNDDRLRDFNSQQTADYLRSVDDTKLGKSLAKRAANSGLDFTEQIKEEIKNMKENISELNEIDYSNDPISFYLIFRFQGLSQSQILLYLPQRDHRQFPLFPTYK